MPYLIANPLNIADQTITNILGNTNTAVDNTIDYILSGGNLGNALKFDGTNDYVVVPHAATLNLTTEYTIAFHVKNFNLGIAAIADWVSIVQKDGNGTGNYGILIYRNPVSTPWIRVYPSANTYLWTDYTYGRDYVVTVVKSTTNEYIYIDGNLKQTYSTVDPTPNGSNLLISNNTTFFPYYYDGVMAFMTIFNKALSIEEVIHIAQLEGDVPLSAKPFCVLDLKFDNKSGTSITDQSGNGNNGTATNFGVTTNLGGGAWVDAYTLNTITI